MPADRNVTLDINLLGRDYKVGCKESERAELGEAVAYLDGKLREIRGAGKVTGADRIAVMAALNIAHELLRERRAGHAAALAPPPAANGDAQDPQTSKRRIQAMGSAIDELLASQEKLF
ncbi:MAG: cell division protein ZapA [Proteobacteria bacterium]|nr:cell division protein ZapA [Pseudomonadota bacterium]